MPLLVLVWALLVLTGAIAHLLPVRALCPEIGVVLAVYLGLSLHRSVSAIAATAFGAGYVTDLLAAAPKGMFALGLLTLCLLVRAASVHVDVRGHLRMSGFVALAALASGLMVTVLRWVISDSVGMSALALVPLQAFINGFFAVPLLALLRRVGGPISGGEGSDTARIPLTRGAG